MPSTPGNSFAPQPDVHNQGEVDDVLEQIIAVMRYDAAVFGQWGLDRRVKRGTLILLAGGDGPAKAAAVERLAKEAGKGVRRIDLRGVVSKHIGETEKNLRKLFAGAEDDSVILFFDDADALFGKRSDVKDAHDRHANIEAAYLLQRLEDFPGLAIFALSDKRNLDEAFLRRIRFIVDFPMSDHPK